jgi:hypothetical protein
MRHHAETSATTIADLMLADLRLSHHTLVQQFDGISLRSSIRCGEAAVLLFAAIDLLFRAIVQEGRPGVHFGGTGRTLWFAAGRAGLSEFRPAP